MVEIERVYAGEDTFVLGDEVGFGRKRKIEKIVCHTDMRNNPSLIHVAGYDENNDMVFECFSKDVTFLYRKITNHDHAEFEREEYGISDVEDEALSQIMTDWDEIL